MNFFVARIVVALVAGASLCGPPARAAESGAAPITAGAPRAAPNRVLGAVGIGVKDLAASVAFYSDVLGMQVTRRFELGYLNEVVLGFPGGGGTSVVLMNWPSDATRRYDGGNVKLVFYVQDPAAVLARIRARGGRIDREAAPVAALDGTIVGLGRDPDNYVVEVIAQ